MNVCRVELTRSGVLIPHFVEGNDILFLAGKG